MTQKTGKSRYWLSFTGLFLLLMIFTVWNINSGTIELSLKEIAGIIFQRQGEETAFNIIWEIRLPRIIACVVLGARSLYQVFFCRHFLQILLQDLLNLAFLQGQSL